MTRYALLIFAAAFAATAYAASGDALKPAPGTGATETVTQAAPPAAPPTTPAGGFPVIAIPIGIAVGLGVALAAEENDSVQVPTATTTR